MAKTIFSFLAPNEKFFYMTQTFSQDVKYKLKTAVLGPELNFICSFD